MAVAEVGTTSTLAVADTSATRTLNYTLDSGANCLVVRVHWLELGPTLNSVTWGGVAMTSIGAPSVSSGGHTVQMFRLVNPTPGTADVVATFSASQFYCIVAATGLSGVKTDSPNSSYQTGNATSSASPASIAAVTSKTGDLVINALTRDDDNGMTAQNQTSQYAVIDNDPSLVGCGGKAAGAASVDPEWTYTGTATWAMASVNFEAGAVTVPVGALTFTGLAPVIGKAILMPDEL